MPITKSAETITVIGPQERQADGSITTLLGPRQLPKRLWDNPETRAALIAIGVRPQNEAMEPSPSVKVRAATTQKQLDEQAAEIEALKQQLAAVLAAKEPANQEPFKLKLDTDASQA